MRNIPGKKIHRVLEFNQSQWLKPYDYLIHKKEQKQKKRRQRWKCVVQINGKCCIR